jgi:hypothetical protein
LNPSFKRDTTFGIDERQRVDKDILPSLGELPSKTRPPSNHEARETVPAATEDLLSFARIFQEVTRVEQKILPPAISGLYGGTDLA